VEVAHSVALGILSGADARDPRWVPAPLHGPAVDGPIRVAVVRDPLGGGIDPHVRAGIDRTADWLADAGYDVLDAEPPQIAEATAAWYGLIWTDLDGLWPNMAPIATPGAVEFVSKAVAAGVLKALDQAGQLAAWIARYQIGAAWAQFSQDHPILLAPVCCERPWLAGEDISRIDEVANAMRMVLPVNLLGLPSCAVPVGCDDGLPQGVQRHRRPLPGRPPTRRRPDDRTPGRPASRPYSHASQSACEGRKLVHAELASSVPPARSQPVGTRATRAGRVLICAGTVDLVGRTSDISSLEARQTKRSGRLCRITCRYCSSRSALADADRLGVALAGIMTLQRRDFGPRPTD
jgi:hypothetical protein